MARAGTWRQPAWEPSPRGTWRCSTQLRSSPDQEDGKNLSTAVLASLESCHHRHDRCLVP